MAIIGHSYNKPLYWKRCKMAIIGHSYNKPLYWNNVVLLFLLGGVGGDKPNQIHGFGNNQCQNVMVRHL